MVPAQQEEVLGVLDLVGQQQADGLQGLLASVHVVAQEQVVALGREASVFKQPKQVVVLAVDVACGGRQRVSSLVATAAGKLNVQRGAFSAVHWEVLCDCCVCVCVCVCVCDCDRTQ